MVVAEYDSLITDLPNAYLKWLYGKLSGQRAGLG